MVTKCKSFRQRYLLAIFIMIIGIVVRHVDGHTCEIPYTPVLHINRLRREIGLCVQLQRHSAEISSIVISSLSSTRRTETLNECVRQVKETDWKEDAHLVRSDTT